MRRVVGAAAVVGGCGIGDIARIVTLDASCAQAALDICTAVALGHCHDTHTDMAHRAVAVRAVVQIGVVRAASVFDERSVGDGVPSHSCLLCKTEVEVPSLCVNIRAGVQARRRPALCRPHLEGAACCCGCRRCLCAGVCRRFCGRGVGGCGYGINRRTDAAVGEEVAAAVDHGSCRDSGLDKRLRLIIHGNIAHFGDKLILQMGFILGVRICLVLCLTREQVELVAQADAVHALCVADARRVYDLDRLVVAAVHLVCLHQTDRVADVQRRAAARKSDADVDIAQILLVVVR